MFPSILIQLENGPNEFHFYFFISSSDTNLLQKKSVKQKIKKTMALASQYRTIFNSRHVGGNTAICSFHSSESNIDRFIAIINILFITIAALL